MNPVKVGIIKGVVANTVIAITVFLALRSLAPNDVLAVCIGLIGGGANVACWGLTE
jgi:hypothetical protein